jgi:trimeric autotransporter adhesin
MKKLPEENAMKHMSILTVAVVFAWFGLCAPPNTFGVAPPPDGGYPSGNTAEGQSALLSLTNGLYNTGIGIFSLLSLTDGSFCTGVGAGTLLANTGDSNTATGAGALFSNTSGTDNTADGTFALFSNTASGNTAIGSNALLNNTTGGTLENIQGIDVSPNVAVGWQALESNTVASANTALGYQALHSFTGPVGLEQVGLCTAVGFQALANATGGLANSGFGYQTLLNNTNGTINTAIGYQALLSNTEGGSNTANGGSALFSNTTGHSNTAIGSDALHDNTTGISNTALGHGAGLNVTSAHNVICIGHAGANVDNSCFIDQIFGRTATGGTAVFISSDGKLGTTTSSRRFKKEIQPMDGVSEAILALKPVTFHYKNDNTNIPQFGLIAEEVAKVNPDLVVRDEIGEIYTVRYEAVNAMLLNEFLKEHRKVQELERRMTVLTARIDEHPARIQKVSAQAKMNKFAAGRIRRCEPTTKVALDNP